MEQELQNRIDVLEQQVNELQQKVNAIYSDTGFPDSILNLLSRKGFMRLKEKIRSFNATFGYYYYDVLWESDSDSFFHVAYRGQDLKKFTVNPTTDVCTSASHGFTNGDLLRLRSSGTLPAPLAIVTNYYVISATNDTYKLSLSPGGSAINITDVGTGVHYVEVIDFI